MNEKVRALERQVDELKNEVRQLKLRLEKVLSRKGGQVSGQIHLDGWVQFSEQTISAPSDGVRFGHVESGGVRQLIAIWPSGATDVIAQE